MSSLDRKARAIALLGTAIFLFVAPGTVAGFLPWWIGRWHVHASFFGLVALRAVGGLLLAAGFVLLIEAFLRFALEGIGTPAPIYPAKHLVVTGSYQYVRNPMYIAVVSLIFGQGLIFGDFRILVYGLFVWAGSHVFVVMYEEPALRRSFPVEYAVYCEHVSRWIPRLKPWRERI